MGSGKKSDIKITNNKGRLSDEEIQRMVDEAKEYEQQDNAARERVDARNGLETYAHTVKSTLSEHGDKLSADDKATVERKAEEVMKWLDPAEHAEKEEFESMQKDPSDWPTPSSARCMAARPDPVAAAAALDPLWRRWTKNYEQQLKTDVSLTMQTSGIARQCGNPTRQCCFLMRALAKDHLSSR